MRTTRTYCNQPLEAGVALLLEGHAAHHLSRVLRLTAGDTVELFNGDGCDYVARLTLCSKGAVRAEVLERRENHRESPLEITLVQAVSRGDRMDQCIQKSTELGVARVQLALSERVEVKLRGERLNKRLAHWQGVITSACEQCGRATLPELAAPIHISDWKPAGMAMVLDPQADKALPGNRPEGAVEIAVGPEGGFTEREISAMVEHGAIAMRLGPRTLRTETAGPAAIAAFQAMWGDFAGPRK